MNVRSAYGLPRGPITILGILEMFGTPQRSFYESGTALLTAMANEKRLQILDILSKGEMPVFALSEMVGLSQSALSQHLGKLRAGNLVSTRRDAQTVYYRCETDSVKRVLTTLTEIFQGTLDDISAAA